VIRSGSEKDNRSAVPYFTGRMAKATDETAQCMEMVRNDLRTYGIIRGHLHLHLAISICGGDLMKPEELHVDYDSPIEVDFATNLISNMSKELADHIDEQTFHAICQAGFFIDRKKMVQVLKQDKERYTDAYRRGYMKREEDIIRCKDCIFLESSLISINGEPIKVCNIHNSYPVDDYYCADAVRREENE